MPIIAPRVTAKSGTVITFDSSVMMPAPMPTPNRATPIGRPIASTDPKAMIKMTIAIARGGDDGDGVDDLDDDEEDEGDADDLSCLQL